MQFLGESIKNIHKSWNDFILAQEDKLKDIEAQISTDVYTPEARNILRFLSTNLNEIKVIILGQDPYPQKGVATGRAFEVGTLKSWSERFSNVSLKNIIRAIYKAEKGEILKINEIINTKLNQSFHILPPDKLFSNWEQQGVLLLNTSFTCAVGNPGSHAKIWRNFTKELLEFIVEKNKNAYWFLWGDHAMKAVQHIEIAAEYKVASFHPMMCYDRENDFLFSSPNCFELTKEIIDWTGTRDAKKISIEQQKLF